MDAVLVSQAESVHLVNQSDDRMCSTLTEETGAEGLMQAPADADLAMTSDTTPNSVSLANGDHGPSTAPLKRKLEVHEPLKKKLCKSLRAESAAAPVAPSCGSCTACLEPTLNKPCCALREQQQVQDSSARPPEAVQEQIVPLFKTASAGSPDALATSAQLGQQLEPLLARNGGLGDLKHVSKFEQLLAAEMYWSRRLMLLVVIKSSSQTCLQRMVAGSTLKTLDRWLNEANEAYKNGKDVRFLLQILETLMLLPLSIDLLKEVAVGQTVGRLRKHDAADVKKAASELVDAWKKLVGPQPVRLDARKDDPTKRLTEVKKMDSGPPAKKAKIAPELSAQAAIMDDELLVTAAPVRKVVRPVPRKPELAKTSSSQPKDPLAPNAPAPSGSSTPNHEGATAGSTAPAADSLQPASSAELQQAGGASHAPTTTAGGLPSGEPADAAAAGAASAARVPSLPSDDCNHTASSAAQNGGPSVEAAPPGATPSTPSTAVAAGAAGVAGAAAAGPDGPPATRPAQQHEPAGVQVGQAGAQPDGQLKDSGSGSSSAACQEAASMPAAAATIAASAAPAGATQAAGAAAGAGVAVAGSMLTAEGQVAASGPTPAAPREEQPAAAGAAAQVAPLVAGAAAPAAPKVEVVLQPGEIREDVKAAAEQLLRTLVAKREQEQAELAAKREAAAATAAAAQSGMGRQGDGPGSHADAKEQDAAGPTGSGAGPAVAGRPAGGATRLGSLLSTTPGAAASSLLAAMGAAGGGGRPPPSSAALRALQAAQNVQLDPEPSAPRRVKRKKVSWVADEELLRVRFFRKDDPVINVKEDCLGSDNLSPGREPGGAVVPPGFEFAARSTREHQDEKQAMMAHHQQEEKEKAEMQDRLQRMVPSVPWMEPQRCSWDPSWLVAAGEESMERGERQSHVSSTPPVRYLSEWHVPSTPYEPSRPEPDPDPNRVPIIPLAVQQPPQQLQQQPPPQQQQLPLPQQQQQAPPPLVQQAQPPMQQQAQAQLQLNQPTALSLAAAGQLPQVIQVGPGGLAGGTVYAAGLQGGMGQPVAVVNQDGSIIHLPVMPSLPGQHAILQPNPVPAPQMLPSHASHPGPHTGPGPHMPPGPHSGPGSRPGSLFSDGPADGHGGGHPRGGAVPGGERRMGPQQGGYHSRGGGPRDGRPPGREGGSGGGGRGGSRHGEHGGSRRGRREDDGGYYEGKPLPPDQVPCKFFNSPQGCRNGDACRFLHSRSHRGHEEDLDRGGRPHYSRDDRDEWDSHGHRGGRRRW